MAMQTILNLNGRSYEVQQFEQNFYLESIRSDGYTVSFLPCNGELYIVLDSPTDNFLLELMYDAWSTPIVEGELNVFDVLQDLPVRKIVFRRAYITLHQEHFRTNALSPHLLEGESNMKIVLCITPQEMVINKTIRIARNYSWQWEKVKDDELMPHKKVSNPEIRLQDAYWIKDDGSRCRVFPLDKKVCLYLVLVEFEAFIGNELEFEFMEETKDGVYAVSVKGKVPNDGIIVIRDFLFSKKGE